MLKSKKFEAASLFIKALSNFVAEVGEATKVEEKENGFLHIPKFQMREIEEHIKEIELLIESEIGRYPKNEKLKKVKAKIDNLNGIIKDAKFNH